MKSAQGPETYMPDGKLSSGLKINLNTLKNKMTYEKEKALPLRRRLQLSRIFLYSFFAFLLNTIPAEAYVDGTISFQWQPNPSEENVTSYRLYYGSQSRYDSSGNPKSNFVYDYYIDLSESVQCNNLSYNNDCEYLPRNALYCDGLSNGTPQCTLSNLQGTLHLALTARSSLEESNYTQEIKIAPNSQSTPPPGSGSSNARGLPAIRMLLLKSAS